MKKLFFITVIFSICSFSYANSYEFLFCAKQDSSFITTAITIYRYNYGTKGYNLIGSGSTLTTSVTLYNNTSWNGLAYVDGVSGMDKSPTILPTNRSDSLIDSVDTYLIKVENLYAIIQPNPSGFDAQIYYTVTNNLPSLYVSTAGSVIAQNFPLINFSYVDCEKSKELAAQQSIFSVPTILFFFEGKEYIRKARFVNLDELQSELERIFLLID